MFHPAPRSWAARHRRSAAPSSRACLAARPTAPLRSYTRRTRSKPSAANEIARGHRRRRFGGEPSVPEVVEGDRHVADLLADQRHGRLQVVALGARDAHRIALDGRLHFEFAVLDEAGDLFGLLAFDAAAHLEHLLDLVAADLLHVALVQETHIDAAFGELVGQDVLDLAELELRVAEQGDFLVLELERGGRALEIEARADLLRGVVHRVL